MKRVLSLLLLIPFLVTQAWALRGGPFDSPSGGSQAALAGTYGISLQGNETAGVDSISTTGVLSLSVPLAGLVTGRILIFDKGLMYLGNTYGHMDSRSGKMQLLAQASHYAMIAIQNTMYTPVVDYNLSGQVNLAVESDFFSGLLFATGNATFARSEPLAASVLSKSTSTNATNATTAVTGATNNSTGGSLSNETETKAASVDSGNVLVVLEPDGSTTQTSTTQTASTTGPDTTKTQQATSTDTSTQGANTAQNATESGNTIYSDINALRGNVAVAGGATVEGSDTVTVTSTAGLTKGMVFSGPGIQAGSTIVKVVDGTTVQLSKPATATAENVAMTANSSSVIYLTMTAEGIREDTIVSPLPVFTPPTTTSFQIGVNQTGVAGAATGAGG